MNREQTTLEKLEEKHFKVFGESPEYSFFAWLDALGMTADEDDLIALLNDEEYWQK